jgi:hypothetical protein
MFTVFGTMVSSFSVIPAVIGEHYGLYRQRSATGYAPKADFLRLFIWKALAESNLSSLLRKAGPAWFKT